MILAQTKKRFREIIEKEILLDAAVSVLARPLTPEEAVGTPGRRDYPIIIGKERILEANFLGAKGHAFTDSAREFNGTLAEVLALELDSNQHRAILVAVLNAVLRHLGVIAATVHCKDDEPEKCGNEIARQLFAKHGRVHVGLIGFNPAIAEHLVQVFGADHVHISDLFPGNIGARRFGVEIWDGGSRTDELIRVCDLLLVSGTTLQNGSFDHIWQSCQAQGKYCLIFGVTGAGVCALCGIDRLCPCAHEN